MVAFLQFGWPFAGQEDDNRLMPLSYGADFYSVTCYSEQSLFFAKDYINTGDASNSGGLDFAGREMFLHSPAADSL